MPNPVTNAFRLAHAGFVLARYDALLPPDQLARAPWLARLGLKLAQIGAQKNPQGGQHNHLTQALSKLGPSYIKLGQFLATRPDVIGAKRAFELKALQDKLPPFPQDVAEAVVEEELGKPVKALFKFFGPPVAAASIAQVHKATTLDGREVAVKILRPGVERRFANDIESFAFAARNAERLSREGRRLRPVAAVAMLEESMVHELDLRMEAAALSEMAQNSKEDPGFRVPAVMWDLSAKRVLVTEWIDGTPMADVEALRQRGLDLHALADTVIQSFLRHAIRDGFFHADMHQGNLFVDAKGNLVALDFGITGRLSEGDRLFLAEILYGFITRNYRRIAQVHFDAGYVPSTEDVETFAQALRAIGEPIMGLPADQISMSRLLTQLFEVTEQFNMQTQPQLLLLQKTMVVTEGVARTLNPDLNIWKSGEPVVKHWIERKLGPLGKVEQAIGTTRSLTGLALRVPKLMQEAHEFHAKLNTFVEAQNRPANPWPTRLLGVCALALVAIALKLVLR
ncbi:2-polyprenylphenol 6-hydroxylase [Aestuariivirga litoralis]|uniref:2-polyprenylphenol 6-hydroxylase n=1 Tax=Aestuariivirga litoralis TaxID=2650924 RepID=UPI0018C74F59|nr:2-polyprenylphenol 6-hydroxylase [Aestuariivirga litoralis]MBG1233839.1 2-polyprenylphenol 6-hydroxylase [Aestuariivirga litoralis]